MFLYAEHALRFVSVLLFGLWFYSLCAGWGTLFALIGLGPEGIPPMPWKLVALSLFGNIPALLTGILLWHYSPVLGGQINKPSSWTLRQRNIYTAPKAQTAEPASAQPFSFAQASPAPQKRKAPPLEVGGEPSKAPATPRRILTAAERAELRRRWRATKDQQQAARAVARRFRRAQDLDLGSAPNV